MGLFQKGFSSTLVDIKVSFVWRKSIRRKLCRSQLLTQTLISNLLTAHHWPHIKDCNPPTTTAAGTQSVDGEIYFQ